MHENNFIYQLTNLRSVNKIKGSKLVMVKIGVLVDVEHLTVFCWQTP